MNTPIAMYINQADALEMPGYSRHAYRWQSSGMTVFNIDTYSDFCIVVYKRKNDDYLLVELREAFVDYSQNWMVSVKTNTIPPHILKNANESLGYGIETIEVDGRLLFKCKERTCYNRYRLCESTVAFSLLNEIGEALGIYLKYQSERIKTIQDAFDVKKLLVDVQAFMFKVGGYHETEMNKIESQINYHKGRIENFENELRKHYDDYFAAKSVIQRFGVKFDFPE